MRRRKAGRSVLLSIALIVAAANSATAAAVIVQDVLRSLQDSGFDILYSSDLVPPELSAPEPARSATPLQRAAGALALHGLELRSIGPRTFLVVRMAKVQAEDVQPDPVLDEISVFGSRYSLVGQSHYDQKVFDGTEIQNIPGGHEDPMRSLRALPGVASTVSARPYIRGSLSNDVLIRYDGVTLLDPYHLKNFQSSYGAIDPFAVGSMDVYSSGYPVRYGTRSGGVIDISPPAETARRDIALTVSRLSLAAAISGVSDRWPIEWLGTVRRNITDMVLEPFDAEHGSPRVIDGTGLLRWSVNDHSDVHAGWLLLDDRLNAGKNSDDGSAVAHYRDQYFWLAFAHRSDSHWSSRSTVSVTDANRSRQGEVSRPLISTGHVAESSRYSKSELATDWKYEPPGSWSATLGAAAATTDSEYRYTRSLLLSPDIARIFSRPASDDLAGNGSPNADTFSAYGSVRRIWSALTAEVGLRLDGQDYGAGPAHHQWGPRANLEYDLDSRWRFFGSIGRFTQAQAVEEWRAEELQQKPDPVQNAVHTVVGLTFDQNEGTRWSLEFYRKRWTRISPYFESELDPLSLLPDLAPDRIRVAPDNSEASGLELSLRTRMTDSLRGWAGVTIARVADEFTGKDQLRSWDQPAALNAGLAWTGVRTQFSIMAGWHTGWPRTSILAADQGIGATIAIGTRNSDRWDDYLSVDARGSWMRPALGGELTVFAEVTNATDQHNKCCAFLDSPASEGALPQIVRSNWLPLILNLGITLRWRSDP
jgi:TonB-dependent Receptor Plug Domain